MAAESRRVTFLNTTGETLVGIAQGSSSKVVVLCHGYSDHKDAFHLKQIAQALGEVGCSSLRFDFAGNGESGGTFEFGNYKKEVEDIRAAVTFARGELEYEVVGLVGHSKGGNDVLLYAAKYDDVPTVVNVAARFHMDRGVAERFGQATLDAALATGRADMVRRTAAGPVPWVLTRASLEERLHHTDMDAAARAIRRTRVITIHGSADTTIPVGDAREFAARVRGHTLEVVEGADHNFRGAEHAARLVALVAAAFRDGAAVPAG